MKKSKRGGARKGAGRKKGEDNKILVPLWIRKSIVKSKGGKKGMQKYLYSTIEIPMA